MALWNMVSSTGVLPYDFPWVAAVFAVAALALHVLAPKEQKNVRGAVALFALALAGMLVAVALVRLGVPSANPFFRGVCEVALLLGGVAMANLGSVVIFAVVLRAVRLEPPPIAQDLILALSYVVVGMFSLSHAGVNLQGIIATSAVLTAVIGFSLQDSLGNVMGGMVLQVEHTIRPGDWIKVDDLEGRVKQIRWRQTSLETRNWDTVVIPNSMLMKGKVTLLGRRTGQPVQRRQWVYFRVGLAHSPTKVIHTVEQVLRAERHGNIATEPKPQCLLTDFKDGEAVYAARYWLADLSQGDPTDSLVRTRIYAGLLRAGIALEPAEQRVQIQKRDETDREREAMEELERRQKALERQELFQTLTPEEREELAGRLSKAHFVRGEAITRQGAEAHWLYIIAEGDADVEISHDGREQKVATLRAGDLFGEMGLMTGEPRKATVSARTEVVCYRLDREEFVEILRRRPEIAEQISMILAKRTVELEAVREKLDQSAQGERVRKVQGALLRGIRDFLNI